MKKLIGFISFLVIALSFQVQAGTYFDALLGRVHSAPNSSDIGYTDTYSTGHTTTQSILDFLIAHEGTAGITNINNTTAYGAPWNSITTYAPSLHLMYSTLQGFQTHDTDLDIWATLTPSTNAQTLVGETFAQMLASIGAAPLTGSTVYSPIAGSTSIATIGTLAASTYAYPATVDYDTRTDEQPVYVGYAPPGTATSSAAWIIIKYNFTSNVPSDPLPADGVYTATKAWDNRASYSY